MICDSRFHRWGYAQSLVNPAEVVVHEVERDVVLQVLNLLAECVCQSGKAAHSHSHTEILTLDKAGGNIFGIRVARDFDCNAAGARRRAVVRLTPARSTIHFDKHRIVNLAAKGILNSAQIRLMTVCCKLDAVGEAAFQIVDELIRRARVACAHQPAGNQLCIGINRRPRPYIAVAPLALLFFWYILLFGVHERPYFVALNLCAFEVAHDFILIVGAGATSFDQELDHAVNRDIHHSSSGADAVALDKTTKDLNSPFSIQFVHTYNMLARASIVNNKVLEVGKI